MLPVGTNIEVKKFPRATLWIIGINILVFIGEVLLPPGSLNWIFDHFGFSAFTRNPFTPISSMFLHGDIFHIVGNMVFLWIFGPPVEERIGAKKFVYYYFGAGLWSTALWAVMQQISHPGSQGVVIGASGAISGVIALYLYRCFYSKLKMVVDPLFLPWKVHIPAAPLIIFWFLRDMLGGIASLSQAAGGVAYWGHVGGFFFGLAVARIKRYGHEARLEHVKGRLLSKLQAGDGWSSVNAEKELSNLLKIAPNDPEVHHQFAQFCCARQRAKEAAEHYQFAIQKYFLSNPLHGAFTVIEHLDALKRPMAGHYHLKAAETLSRAGWTEEAYKAVRPLIGTGTDAVAEKTRVLFVKLCASLHRREEAEEAALEFEKKHPRSRYLADVHTALTMKPEKIFPPRREEPAAADPMPDDEQEEARPGKGLSALAFSARTVTDPLFFFLWLVVLMVLQFGSVLRGTTAYEYFWKLPLAAFVTAFGLTAIIRTPWTELFRYANRQSEEKARMEVDISMTANKAKLAERGENFAKAAELYEKLLALDPRDIQARFSLARIYQSRLNDQGKARRHYRELLKYAPPEHPFFHEAESVIRASGAK